MYLLNLFQNFILIRRVNTSKYLYTYKHIDRYIHIYKYIDTYNYTNIYIYKAKTKFSLHNLFVFYQQHESRFSNNCHHFIFVCMRKINLIQICNGNGRKEETAFSYDKLRKR